MAEVRVLARQVPWLRQGVLQHADQVLTIKTVTATGRCSLRCEPDVAERLAAAWRFPLPMRLLRSEERDGSAGLRLGPDEWLLLPAPPDLPVEGLSSHEASLVDVSHQLVGLEISGNRAGDVLNTACPLDLDPAYFEPGMCTRTLFGKIEIILWRRQAGATFRVEFGRSVARYVASQVEQVANQILLEG